MNYKQAVLRLLGRNYLVKRDDVLAIQVKENLCTKDELIQDLKQSIYLIDKKLIDRTQKLVEAQMVGLKSVFSQNNNLFSGIQKNFYSAAAQNTADWYRKEIRDLRIERKFLQERLDKTLGKYWLKKILKIITITFMLCLAILIIWIILLGILTTFYLLPIWGSIILAYWLIRRINAKGL